MYNTGFTRWHADTVPAPGYLSLVQSECTKPMLRTIYSRNQLQNVRPIYPSAASSSSTINRWTAIKCREWRKSYCSRIAIIDSYTHVQRKCAKAHALYYICVLSINCTRSKIGLASLPSTFNRESKIDVTWISLIFSDIIKLFCTFNKTVVYYFYIFQFLLLPTVANRRLVKRWREYAFHRAWMLVTDILDN